MTKRPNRPAPADGNRGGPPEIGKTRPLQVTDTWPEKVPVTPAELEAIETWLKPLLDEILGGGSG